jgi:Streptomycin 6-kinase
MCIIPATFKSHIIEFHEPQGINWLEQLPTRLAQCAERWQISIGQPFTPLSYHYVVAATRTDGTPVVVKAVAPTDEFPQEVAALRHFDGQGMVQLLAIDESNQIMLLERLTPGTLLKYLYTKVKSVQLLWWKLVLFISLIKIAIPTPFSIIDITV